MVLEMSWAVPTILLDCHRRHLYSKKEKGNTEELSEKQRLKLSSARNMTVTGDVADTEVEEVHVLKKTWKGYIWDSLDKTPQERRFLLKLDLALLVFGCLGTHPYVVCVDMVALLTCSST